MNGWITIWLVALAPAGKGPRGWRARRRPMALHEEPDSRSAPCPLPPRARRRSPIGTPSQANAPDDSRSSSARRRGGVDVAHADGARRCREPRRLVDDRHDRARDQVPVLAQIDRDDRLEVEDLDHHPSVPALKLKLFWNGTLIRLATGFCVSFASWAVSSSAAGFAPSAPAPGRRQNRRDCRGQNSLGVEQPHGRPNSLTRSSPVAGISA